MVNLNMNNLVFDYAQEAEDKAKELKSRGLCLVPVSCTQHVVTQNEWHGRGF